MIGYVFIRSGAIQTTQPELYPARQNQLDNLRFGFEAIGEDDARVCIEKVPVVTGLASLPKLGTRLAYAARNSDRVMIDDFRRLFLVCAIENRGDLFKQLWVFRDVFWELQGDGRALASISKEHLSQLIHAQSRVKFRLKPKAIAGRTKASLKWQTSRARLASTEARSTKADAAASKLQDLREEMIATHPSVTLDAIAIEANERRLKTSRGNPWSASSVYRALKRCDKQPNSPDQ